MRSKSAQEAIANIEAIPTETVLQSMGKALMLMSLGAKVTAPWEKAEKEKEQAEKERLKEQNNEPS